MFYGAPSTKEATYINIIGICLVISSLAINLLYKYNYLEVLTLNVHLSSISGGIIIGYTCIIISIIAFLKNAIEYYAGNNAKK